MKKIILVVALLVTGAFALPADVNATGLSGPVEIEGFAWSSTIGWISMNCSNEGLGGCATSDYKVEAQTDGSMTGYAWSPNVGWIRFDVAGPYPSGSGTADQSATVVGNHPNATLAGWARACVGATNALACSGGINAAAGGWDGWISLDGSSYGVEFVNGDATANSFAWGGPITMGWIDFSPDVAAGPAIPPVRFGPTTDIIISSVTHTPGTPDAGGFYDVVTFTANVQGIPLGETVDWEISLGGITDSGTVTQTASGPDFSSIPTLVNVPFNVADPLVLEIDMPEPGTVRETDETNIYTDSLFSLAVPPPTMTISGPEVIRSGETAEVSWEVSAPYPVTCTVRGPGINETVIVAGALGAPDTQSGSVSSAVLQNAAQFEVSCTVGPDTYTETYQVEVIPTFQEI